MKYYYVAVIIASVICLFLNSCCKSQYKNTISRPNTKRLNKIESKSTESSSICTHQNLVEKTTMIPTCLNNGNATVVCSDCGIFICNKTLNRVGHKFKDWIYSKSPTPIDGGRRYRECYLCKYKEYEDIPKITLKNNQLYIPAIGIDVILHIGEFTQEDTDSNDVVYTEDASWYKDDPFIFGHNYRSLKVLYNIKVNDLIYINVNNKLEVYKVIISEYALYNKEQNDEVGQTTNTSIWHRFDTKTLHISTCHPTTEHQNNGRWIVLATLISQ